jgi:hypothetical protein
LLSYPAAIPRFTRTLTRLADLLRARQAHRCSRWRRLDAGAQALLVLAHLRNGGTYTRLTAGFASVRRPPGDDDTCAERSTPAVPVAPGDVPGERPESCGEPSREDHDCHISPWRANATPLRLGLRAAPAGGWGGTEAGERGTRRQWGDRHDASPPDLAATSHRRTQQTPFGGTLIYRRR